MNADFTMTCDYLPCKSIKPNGALNWWMVRVVEGEIRISKLKGDAQGRIPEDTFIFCERAHAIAKAIEFMSSAG